MLQSLNETRSFILVVVLLSHAVAPITGSTLQHILDAEARPCVVFGAAIEDVVPGATYEDIVPTAPTDLVLMAMVAFSIFGFPPHGAISPTKSLTLEKAKLNALL